MKQEALVIAKTIPIDSPLVRRLERALGVTAEVINYERPDLSLARKIAVAAGDGSTNLILAAAQRSGEEIAIGLADGGTMMCGRKEAARLGRVMSPEDFMDTNICLPRYAFYPGTANGVPFGVGLEFGHWWTEWGHDNEQVRWVDRNFRSIVAGVRPSINTLSKLRSSVPMVHGFFTGGTIGPIRTTPEQDFYDPTNLARVTDKESKLATLAQSLFALVASSTRNLHMDHFLPITRAAEFVVSPDARHPTEIHIDGETLPSPFPVGVEVVVRRSPISTYITALS